MSIEGIKEIHDLHVWNPSAESIALAVHITVPDQMLGRVDEMAGSAHLSSFELENQKLLRHYITDSFAP
jgi:Co/Zn/Cd efflux system component